jgi:hypothetical protein
VRGQNDRHKEEAMDVLPIFPVLLLFMVAALLALGYALYRLERVAGGVADLPLSSCDRCGQRLDVAWRHCPTCGTAIELPPLVDLGARRDDLPVPLEAGRRS